MSGDNDSIVNNPLFGTMIGIQIGNNAHAEADKIRSESETSSAKNAATNGLIVSEVLSKRVDALRNEVEVISDTEVNYACSIAGVRGVTRELLEELRKSDPNNPLLDKKIRDKIFDSNKVNFSKKLNGSTNKEKANSINPTQWRDEAYGAENSDKSGPEKSKITPNIHVRSDAEVPSHVSDREKLLSLVERLSAEVKKNNPDAAILQDKVMLDVFADYTINEMVRQEMNKPA